MSSSSLDLALFIEMEGKIADQPANHWLIFQWYKQTYYQVTVCDTVRVNYKMTALSCEIVSTQCDASAASRSVMYHPVYWLIAGRCLLASMGLSWLSFPRPASQLNRVRWQLVWAGQTGGADNAVNKSPDVTTACQTHRSPDPPWPFRWQ